MQFIFNPFLKSQRLAKVVLQGVIIVNACEVGKYVQSPDDCNTEWRVVMETAERKGVELQYLSKACTLARH